MNRSCVKCGEQIEVAHRFCWNCGTARDSISLSEELKPLNLVDFLAYASPPVENASPKSLTFLASAGLLCLIMTLITRQGCLFIPLTFIVFIFIISARRRARKYLIDPHQKLQGDNRLPVLYLRPFQADTDSELVSQDFTLEEELTSALDEIGPAVAVGVPGEDLPALGAIRLYFPHSEWQEKVKALMSISQLVVIQAGFSEGVEWELATSLKLLNPKRVVISFLSWQSVNPTRCQSNYEVFLMLAERVFGKKYELFPKHIGDNFFMYFNDGWVPSLSESRLKGINSKSIRSALEPIFRNVMTVQ